MPQHQYNEEDFLRRRRGTEGRPDRVLNNNIITMSMDHSSLVATFKEKLRPRYYGKSGAANSSYIKENVYFNGVALKESLLHDNDYLETQTPKRILFSHNKTSSFSNNNQCFELEKGCFIYQNPTSHCEDNDFVRQFTNMSLVNELEVVNSNYYTQSLDSDTYKLVKRLKVDLLFIFLSLKQHLC